MTKCPANRNQVNCALTNRVQRIGTWLSSLLRPNQINSKFSHLKPKCPANWDVITVYLLATVVLKAPSCATKKQQKETLTFYTVLFPFSIFLSLFLVISFLVMADRLCMESNQFNKFRKKQQRSNEWKLIDWSKFKLYCKFKQIQIIRNIILN